MQYGTVSTDRGVPGRRAVRTSGPVVLGLDDRPIEEQQAAVRFAAAEANRRRSAIVLAHGRQPLTTMTSLQSEESAVDRERAAVELLATGAKVVRHHLDPERPIEVRLGQGTGVDTLLDLSETASVIVLQRRDIGRLQRWHTGSTTAPVAAEAQCPVVILRDDHEETLSRSGVVVGVDERGHASVAVETAFAEASLRQSSLIAAHAWQIPGPTVTFGYVAADPGEIDVVQEQAQLELAEALAGFGSTYPDVPVRRELRAGVPQQVLDAASAEAELLVIGRHSSSRMPTFALGAVARHCIANSACPVMVVPAARSQRHAPPRWLTGELPLGAGY